MSALAAIATHTASRKGKRPIESATVVIDCLASSATALGVTELSKRLGLTKSNVSRTLAVLESVQWVRQDPETNRFLVGSRVLELGVSALARLDVRRISTPYLRQLRDASGETAMLILRVGLEQLPIDQVVSTHELRTEPRLGILRPSWATAPGKVMVAHLEEAEIEAVIDRLLQSGVRVLASGQRVDIAQFREELAQIRRRGFAVSVGERLVGAVSVAAPIFDHQHRPVAVLCATGPMQRFTPERASEFGPEVARVAIRISKDLGDMPDTAHAWAVVGSSPTLAPNRPMG